MAVMESRFSISDTTAVKIFGNFILAGIGRSVYVFSIQRKKLLAEREVLSRYNVRGIALNSDGDVLVYGGKEGKILKFTENADKVEISDGCFLKSDDWIVYSMWLECSEIAMLSAHNVVTIWNNDGIVIMRGKCQEQSILYSGFLFGDKRDDLICFAGTVFGQVLIWSLDGKKSESEKYDILHYLKGHKGAIFSIRFDPVSNYICTTSDDRSVRWWHISYPLAEPRLTTESLSESWSAALIHPVSVGYGHLSRVWKCFISPSLTFTAGEDSQFCVWRNVEMKQGLANDEQQKIVFPLIARKQILRGGSIWDLDFSPSDELMVLGLEDGGVHLWELNSLVSQALISSHSALGRCDPTRRVCLYGKELKPVIVTKSGTILIKGITDNGLPRWYNACQKKYLGLCLLESSLDKKLVALTSSDGSLDILSASGDAVPENDGSLKQVAGVTLEGDYMLSLHWLADDLLLTCRSKGQLQLWHLHQEESGSNSLKEVMTWVLPQSKQCWTTAAVWIPWEGPPGLVLCGNRAGDLLIYSKESPNPIQTIKHVHGQMGVTSLMVLGPSYNQDMHWMPTYSETYAQPQNQDLRGSCDHLSNAEIYSAGRDGVVNIFVLRKGILKVKGSEKLGFEWAARFLVLNKSILVFGFKGSCAVVWGIKERCMLLEKNCGGGHRSWDLDFICRDGGSHDLLLAMVKTGELITVQWKLPSGTLGASVLQVGLHSKEINCVRCFNWSKNFCATSHGMAFLITGSEDTAAKVSSLCYNCDEKTSSFNTISTIYGHVSSIRALSILPLFSSASLDDGDVGGCCSGDVEVVANGEHFDFLVFSAGGRAQMKAWKLSFDQTDERAVVCPSREHCRAEERFSLMLGYKKQDSKNFKNSLETRFMDIQSFYPKGMRSGNSSILVVVVAACSDGLLRIFGYKESQINAEKAESKPYLGFWSLGIPHPLVSKRHCLFKILHTLYCGHNIVITTDCIGYYHIWDVTGEVESLVNSCELLGQRCADQKDREPFFPIFSKLSHQFSINAIDWIQLSRLAVADQCAEGCACQDPPCLLIATGGEDGALALDLLELCGRKEGEGWKEAVLRASWKLEFAAATQIAGVKFVQNNYLVTVSKCQQVILWKWLCDAERSSVNASVISHCSSTIPDIEDIDVINTKDGEIVIVCGCGLEIVQINVPSGDVR